MYSLNPGVRGWGAGILVLQRIIYSMNGYSYELLKHFIASAILMSIHKLCLSKISQQLSFTPRLLSHYHQTDLEGKF